MTYFHPCIANFTPRTINIDIIFTISIIIETNTNLMTKSGHKHRTLNTSEWISSTTIDLPRKTDEKTRATRLATDWRMLPQRQLLNKGRAAWCVPCAGAFASFARQKKGIEITALNDCNQRLRAKQAFELLRLQKQVFDRPLKLGTPSGRKLVPTIALKFASTKK